MTESLFIGSMSILICISSVVLLFPESAMFFDLRLLKKWEELRRRFIMRKRSAAERKIKKYWLVDVKKLR